MVATQTPKLSRESGEALDPHLLPVAGMGCVVQTAPVEFLLPVLPVTLIGMMQEETEFESTFVLFSDGGSFSLGQFVCLVWAEEALGAGAAAFALWPPVTSTTSLSSVEVA